MFNVVADKFFFTTSLVCRFSCEYSREGEKEKEITTKPR